MANAKWLCILRSCCERSIEKLSCGEGELKSVGSNGRCKGVESDRLRRAMPIAALPTERKGMKHCFDRSDLSCGKVR